MREGRGGEGGGGGRKGREGGRERRGRREGRGEGGGKGEGREGGREKGKGEGREGGGEGKEEGRERGGGGGGGRESERGRGECEREGEEGTNLVCTVVLGHFLSNNEDSLISDNLLVQCHIQGISDGHHCLGRLLLLCLIGKLPGYRGPTEAPGHCYGRWALEM